MEYTTVRTQKGKTAIVCVGYQYNLHGVKSWRCYNRKCQGRGIAEDKLFTLTKEHTVCVPSATAIREELMNAETSDNNYEEENESCNVVDQSNILASSEFGNVFIKAEIQHLIRQKSDRITFKDNENGSSAVWDTFRIIIVDGVLTEYVCCKRCLNIHKYTPSCGTTGLKRHREICLFKSGLSSEDSQLGRIEDEAIDPKFQQLISSIKIRPELYDGTEECLRTENLWSLIAEEVGQNVGWCRKSWEVLLKNFARHCKTQNSSSWVYWDMLNFLEEHADRLSEKHRGYCSTNPMKKRKIQNFQKLIKREILSSELEIPESSDTHNFIDEGSYENDNIQFEYEAGNENHEFSSKRRNVEYNSDDADLWSINFVHQDSRKLDTHDLFCMSLAAQMKSLPKVYASQARLKISEIMHTIEQEVELRL